MCIFICMVNQTEYRYKTRMCAHDKANEILEHVKKSITVRDKEAFM